MKCKDKFYYEVWTTFPNGSLDDVLCDFDSLSLARLYKKRNRRFSCVIVKRMCSRRVK